MSHVIAIAGKGGVGKTTLSGMLIQRMCQMGKSPILAVDADANSNLNEVLGVDVEMTLGDVREQIERSEMSKEQSDSIRNVKGGLRGDHVSALPQ